MKKEFGTFKDARKFCQNSELIVFVGEKKSFSQKSLSKHFDADLWSRVQGLVEKKKDELKDKALFSVLGLGRQADVGLAVLKEGASAFEALTQAREILSALLKPSQKSLSLVLLGSKQDGLWAEAFGASLAARTFSLPSYGKRKEKEKKFQLKLFRWLSSSRVQKALETGFESGQGGNLVRDLAMRPSNFLNPEIYGKEIRRLAKEQGLTLKFYSKAELTKMKAGAFLAVNQGDPDSHGGIYELTYSPRKAKNSKPVALVGKGLCFDTGGYDIKTGGHMASMKADMTGSAVALSSLLTMARMKWPLKLKAYLVITENHISPKAYKADDVVIAMNGRSIEVVNTDAEGRMVLADTLCLASRAKPALMIDYATLTGMAVYAIGTNYSAGFTNEEKFHSLIVEAGKQSGERLWTFPLDSDYETALKSSVADTLQCSRGRGVDHILGAAFLSHFVEKSVPWIHVDLSASENKGGLAHAPSDCTGFGVRWTLEFLRRKFRIS